MTVGVIRRGECVVRFLHALLVGRSIDAENEVVVFAFAALAVPAAAQCPAIEFSSARTVVTTDFSTTPASVIGAAKFRQGYYVGGQADWGSITSKIPAGINSDLQGAFIPPTGVGYNWIGLGQARSINNGFGAFAGYNSQWEDVVVGLEANYLHGAFRSTASSNGRTYLNDNVTLASTTFSSAPPA